MGEHVEVGARLMDSVAKQTINMVLHIIRDWRSDPCAKQLRYPMRSHNWALQARQL